MNFQGRRFRYKPSSRLHGNPRPSPLHWGALLVAALLILGAFMPVLGPDLRWHWASSGLFALCGCLLASRLPRLWVLPGLLIWFTGLGTITLLALWHSGLSDAFTIAGLFPFSDAAGYFSDAQRILVGEPITFFSSRRPLYAAFLAALLKITGNHLRLALWIQTMLVSGSIGWAVWGMLRRTGHQSGTAVFGMTLWLFFRRFIGTTTTENLGLLLGSLGFLTLWEALHDRSIRLFALGLFLTGLALNARAGAFFVLPALLIWGSLHFAEEGQRFSPTALGMGSAALVLAFGITYGVLVLSGGRPGLAFSNFSYTLYGLVHGGNWQLALAQHPELHLLDPGQQASSVFHLALHQIKGHPLALIRGVLRAWMEFLPQIYSFAASQHPWAPTSLASQLLALLALRGLFLVWRSRSTAASRLMFVYLSGIVLSIPFAPPWDSDYMRIFAATVPVLCWLASRGAQTEARAETDPSTPSPSSMFKGLLLASSCLLLSLVLPHIGRAVFRVAPLQTVPGSILRIAPGPVPPESLNPSPTNAVAGRWGALWREKGAPPMPLDRLLENAHSKTSPEGIRTFLKALPREELTLALATGSAWPGRPGYDTHVIVIQGPHTWTFDARGPQSLGAIPPPRLP